MKKYRTIQIKYHGDNIYVYDLHECKEKTLYGGSITSAINYYNELGYCVVATENSLSMDEAVVYMAKEHSD